MTITISKKFILLAVALLLVVGGVIGGTVAWLVDSTGPVTNTFTFGDINITLTETTSDYKIVPGVAIAKDPEVTIEKGSEKCYVFVKIEEKNWSTFVTYSVDDGWGALTGVSGVYYRVVEYNKDTAQEFKVLKDDQLTVSSSLTKNDVETLKANQPTLTFTAYAVQYAGFENDVAAAWAQVSTGTN